MCCLLLQISATAYCRPTCVANQKLLTKRQTCVALSANICCLQQAQLYMCCLIEAYFWYTYCRPTCVAYCCKYPLLTAGIHVLLTEGYFLKTNMCCLLLQISNAYCRHTVHVLLTGGRHVLLIKDILYMCYLLLQISAAYCRHTCVANRRQTCVTF